MKTKTKIVSVVLFLSIVILFISCGKQKTEWQGTIEEENGVTVVKNPKEPLFGEIKFELEEDLSIGSEENENFLFYRAWNIAVDKEGNIYVSDGGNHRIQKFDSDGNYLQTIGRKGQGPGEFESPSNLFLDFEGNIHVLDRRKIVKFSPEGKFLKNINLQSFVTDFCVDIDSNIIAQIHFSNKGERKRAIGKVEEDGKIVKNIAEYSDIKPAVRKSSGGGVTTFSVFHDYTPDLCFSYIENTRFCYGFSPDYKIDIVDSNGDILMNIQKEEPLISISQKEKDSIINRFIENMSDRGRKWPKGVLEEACNFPKSRPFYKDIIVDDKQRIYVWKVKSVLEKSEEKEFDLFSKEGLYLYKLVIPLMPKHTKLIIQKGFLYNISTDEEGVVIVRRYKILNWDHVKEGI
ncbi:MAG: NHL repeat-containing protein [Candidatus Aminicenantes bacterium]|nr:NHL repeat-containing protein [Candidatus Aminicenantes bacterium]